MLKSLSLVAVLVLGAISLPSDAHAATCSATLLSSYSQTWVVNQFGPALACQGNSSYCPGAGSGIGNGCWSPAQNRSCKQCSQQGVTGWWDLSYNQSCGTNPLAIYGWVQYRPNHIYTYTWRCQCSEGVYSCAWQ